MPRVTRPSPTTASVEVGSIPDGSVPPAAGRWVAPAPSIGGGSVGAAGRAAASSGTARAGCHPAIPARHTRASGASCPERASSMSAGRATGPACCPFRSNHQTMSFTGRLRRFAPRGPANDIVWWFERNGQQAGPVALPALIELARSGQLAPEARVWRAGMAGWQPARAVPELAAALPAAPTLPPPIEGAGATQRPAAGGTLPSGMEPTSTLAVVGLGLVTLGIYPMVKFYQAGMAYEALSGRRSRFALYFWISIGLTLVGGPLHALGGIPGFAAHIAAIVFTILTLFEVLA